MVVLGGGAVSYERGTPVALRESKRARVQRRHVAMPAGSYLRLTDSCITHLEAQGPSRTCNESKEEEEKHHRGGEQPASVAVGTCFRINKQAPGREQAEMGVFAPPSPFFKNV